MNGRTVKIIISMCCAVLLTASPYVLKAEDVPAPDVAIALPNLIITEIQTGAGTGHADEEFIELYNPTDEPLDMHGWQLRFVSATAATASLLKPSFRIDLPANVLEPHGYYVLHTAAMTIEGQTYGGNLTANGSLVLLGLADVLTCERKAVDAVAWQEGQWGDGVPVASGGTDSIFVRLLGPNNEFVFTHDNAHDFAALTPGPEATPGVPNGHTLPEEVVPSLAPALTSGTTLAEATCTPPRNDDAPSPGQLEPPASSPPSVPGVVSPGRGSEGVDDAPVPAANNGLIAAQISELLPNPASPQTDADDEFIELYNPNDRPFELGGYVLEVGTTSKRRYSFPAGTQLPARSFVAYFSTDTNLSLSNSGTQVSLLDPAGNPVATADTYGAAKDGQAWILANGSWQWTIVASPGATNVVQAPVAAAKKTSTSSAKSPAVKGTATVAPKVATAKTSVSDAAASQPAAAATSSLPVHPGVLALIGVVAILYGAYEYRHDVANKFRGLRRDRAAGRKDR